MAVVDVTILHPVRSFFGLGAGDCPVSQVRGLWLRHLQGLPGSQNSDPGGCAYAGCRGRQGSWRAGVLPLVASDVPQRQAFQANMLCSL